MQLHNWHVAKKPSEGLDAPPNVQNQTNPHLHKSDQMCYTKLHVSCCLQLASMETGIYLFYH